MTQHASLTSGVADAFSGSVPVGSIFLYIFWALVLGAVVYLIWYLLKFNVKVPIYDHNGFIEYDKGAFVKDKNDKEIKTLQLRKYRHDFTGDIDRDFVIPVKKTLGIGYEVHMQRDSNGNLKPVRPPFTKDITSADAQKWGTISKADRKWAGIKLKETMQKYSREDWWSKYGNMVLQGATIMIVVVAMVIMVRELGAFTTSTQNGLQNVANALREASQSATTQVINSTQ